MLPRVENGLLCRWFNSGIVLIKEDPRNPQFIFSPITADRIWFMVSSLLHALRQDCECEACLLLVTLTSSSPCRFHFCSDYVSLCLNLSESVQQDVFNLIFSSLFPLMSMLLHYMCVYYMHNIGIFVVNFCCKDYYYKLHSFRLVLPTVLTTSHPISEDSCRWKEQVSVFMDCWHDCDQQRDTLLRNSLYPREIHVLMLALEMNSGSGWL